VTVPEGYVSVVPFTDVRAELLPVVVRGWHRAKPRVVVENYGNTLATVAMQGTVQDNSLDFDTRTPSFQIPPGRAYFGTLTVRPERLLWFGRRVRHPFTATVTPSGSAATTMPGTYVQTTLLPSWLARLVATLIALIVAFVILWLAFNPKITTKAHRLPAAASSVAAPSRIAPFV
jgi:hypothetical protein